MPETGISRLAHEQRVFVHKAPFSAAAHRLPNSDHPAAAGPHRETGSRTAFASSNRQMRSERREIAKTRGNQCSALPCRGCPGVRAALKEVRAAARAAPACRRAPRRGPPSVPQGPPPARPPPPRGTSSAGPCRLQPALSRYGPPRSAPSTGIPAPKAPVRGRGGTGRRGAG